MGKSFFSRMKWKGTFLLRVRVAVKSGSKLTLQFIRETNARMSTSGLCGWMCPGEEKGAERETGIKIMLTVSLDVLWADPVEAILGAHGGHRWARLQR